MIEIRQAQQGDIPELRRVSIETQVDTFAVHNTPEVMEAFLRESYSIEKFEEEFKENDAIYYIAWDGSRLAGFVRLRVTDEVNHLLDKQALELQRLYVTRDFRGKKVGANLMQYSIDYARERNFAWLWLGVWEGNIKAQEFYKKWGFQKFSEHIFWMGPDPQNDWLLKLKL